MNPAYLKRLETLCPDRFKTIFLVRHEDEFPVLEETIERLNLNDFAVQPYFNKRNLEFFKDNVFTDHESLGAAGLDLPVIKARTSYNTLNHGKIFVLNDRRIYSDLNAAPLGGLDELSIPEAVVLELTEQGNWLRVRRRVEPCKDCLLDAVCPPLSNFEYAVGINNSCNLWPVKQ